jgi:hypothetical protein
MPFRWAFEIALALSLWVPAATRVPLFDHKQASDAAPTPVALMTPGRFSATSVTEVLTPASAQELPSNPVVAEFHETFEGSWPGSYWHLDDQGPHEGQYLWGKRNCHPFADTYAGWSVGGGTHGNALNCDAHYPDNTRTWAVVGPFDLRLATSANLTFFLWGRTEGGQNCPWDLFFVGSSNDRTIFNGEAYCGDWTNGPEDHGYYRRTLDLRQRLGQSQVWIGLGFVSDSNTTEIGITVDNFNLNIAYPTPTPTPTGRPPTGRLSLPLAIKAGQTSALATPTATATLPIIVTATHTPTPTSTPTPTPTATPTAPAGGHFVGLTNQGRAVQIDLLPGNTLVGRFYIEYSVACPFMTQTGYISTTSPVGWPIANGQFDFQVGAGGGASDRFTGQFNSQFTSVQGTWLIWAVVYDPAPRPVCSNSGTWSATAQ